MVCVRNKNESGIMMDLDEESIKIYGKPLIGKYKHFCIEFDFLPIDEDCFEVYDPKAKVEL